MLRRRARLAAGKQRADIVGRCHLRETARRRQRGIAVARRDIDHPFSGAKIDGFANIFTDNLQCRADHGVVAGSPGRLLALLDGGIMERLKHDRLMLVLTIRTPISPRSLARAALAEIRRLPNTVDMNLAPITNGGIVTLVNDMVTKPSPALLGRIVDICDGNPFFAIHFALHGNPRSISPGLRDLLLSSLDDIEPTRRSILAFLAITGDLTPATSTQYLHTLFPDFDRTIRYFVSKGLVEVAEERIGFHHALLREVVLDDLLPSERSVGHAQAADFLLSSKAALDLGRSGEIARHLLGAGRNAQAIRFRRSRGPTGR